MSIDVLTAEKLRNRSEQIDPAELDELWGALPVVRVEAILGRWRGVPLDNGHRAVQQLASLNWYGKEFVSATDAKPVLCYDENGEIFSNAEAGQGEASLWMVEFRGEVTATMVYDGIPLFDHFKMLDGNTLLAIMNGKDADTVLDDGRYFYFLLERA